MENNDSPVVGNRVWGLVGVAVVFLVIFVIARSNAVAPVATSTTLDFTSDTSVTITTTTTAQESTTSPAEPESPQILSVDNIGWTKLPPNELAPRTASAVVSAGDRVVVWGGVGPRRTDERSDGAIFEDGKWATIAPDPIMAGRDPVVLWTGNELFVYSGTTAAWNPETNAWRQLASPSTIFTSGARPLAGVWTGDQIILVGSRKIPLTREDKLFVTTYGADLQCCRSMPEPPFSLTYGEAFWTGDEMLLFGALLRADGNPMAGGGFGRLAGLDPESGTWTEYDPPPFSTGGRVVAAWTGSKLIAWNAFLEAAEWTKNSGWRPLAGPPFAGGTCRPRTTAVGDDVFAMFCEQAAVWSDAAQRWYTIQVPDTVNWSSELCMPVSGDTIDGVLNVWCSLSEVNAFWRIDLSKVAATRYSGLTTLSQWELLPNPAATRLDSTAMVWSGDELMYFSGRGIEVEEFGGFGHDPGTNLMHGIPDAPSPGRQGQSALWIGDEALIWRGPTILWNPITLEWRTAGRAPALNISPFTVWTGEEAILFGSRIEPSNAGAIYNPENDTWRVMRTAPRLVAIGAQIAAWSGDEMYVLGNWSSFPGSQSGGVYDPTLDSWRPLPQIPEEFAMSGSVGDFVGGEFIVLGENWDPHLTENAPLIAGLAFSPETNTWRTIAPIRTLDDALARPPETHFTTRMAAARHGDELAVFLPAGYSSETPTIAFYNPATDTWRYVEGAPADAAAPTLVSADTFVAYLSPSGTVLLHDG